jgi:hypothetical protein
MVTSVFVDDYINNERYHITIGDKDRKKVEDNWFSKDTLLIDLMNVKFFENKTKWCELRPLHFKVLILRNFLHLDTLKLHQKNDHGHPIVQSLYFLIAGFIKSLNDHADTNVEFLKILRIGNNDINFDYHASLVLQVDMQNSNDANLKVVVDNTKAE